MSGEYFLLFETKDSLPGYPVFFNYDVLDCNTSDLENDCLVYCKGDTVKLRSKNPKLSFDLETVASNYFISNILWEVICSYNAWNFVFKDAVFFGNNKKEVATKKHKVLCFKNKYDPKYIDRLKSLYVIPNFKHKRQAELYKPSVLYEVLNKYDIAPSQFSGYPNCLVVSDKVRFDRRLRNTKLEFIPIEDAGRVLLLRENRVKQIYKVKDQSLLEQLPTIKGKQ